MVENSPLFDLTSYVNQISGELDKYLAELHQHDALIYSRCTARLPGQVRIPHAGASSDPLVTSIPRGQIMASYVSPVTIHPCVGTSRYPLCSCPRAEGRDG